MEQAHFVMDVYNYHFRFKKLRIVQFWCEYMYINIYIKTVNVDLCCNTVIVEVINRQEIAVSIVHIHNDIAMITICIVC